MKNGLKTNTATEWEKHQLGILADMASDHAIPSWYVDEIRRIEEGIILIPGPPSSTGDRT